MLNKNENFVLIPKRKQTINRPKELSCILLKYIWLVFSVELYYGLFMTVRDQSCGKDPVTLHFQGQLS